MLLNGEREPIDVRLPDGAWARGYEVVLDSAGRYPGSLTEPDGLKLTADDVLPIDGPSVIVLRRTA